MFKTSDYLLALLLLPFTTATVQAQVVTFLSGEQKNLLIELYTSQGCSSCPPAERLLSTLVDSDKLWQSYFPIALHVNYWNYLGWADTYSNGLSSERQQQHFKRSNTSNVYTPQFVINGSEWRGFFRSAPLPSLSFQASGRLKLQLDTQKNTADMHFTNLSQDIPAFCHFAWLAFDPPMKITAGENNGITLGQDFALLSLTSSPAEFKNNQFNCKTQLARSNPKRVRANTPKQAFIGWMATSGHKPIQVTGGWLILK